LKEGAGAVAVLDVAFLPEDLKQDDDRISNQHVWSEIRYLDPERNCRNRTCDLAQ
jgi:hypothetical protein